MSSLTSAVPPAPQPADVVQPPSFVPALPPSLRSFQTSPPSSPMRVARDALDVLFTDAHGSQLLIRWRETWWLWQPQGVWAEVSDEIVEGQLQELLENAIYIDAASNAPKMWNPTPKRISDVRKLLQQLCRVSDAITPGGRFDGELEPEGIDVLGGRLVWHEERGWSLEPASPARFNTSTLAVSWEADAPVSELWLTFLRETYDAEGQALLGEWFGYVLSGRTHLQKWLQVVGPPRSGKSLTFKVLEALYGGAAVATSLEALGKPFGLAPLVTAPHALIDDARLNGNAAIERLLSITAHGTQYVDRKNRESLSLRLPTRLTMLSNTPVPISDSSGALDARSLFLRAPVSKRGRENTMLEYALTSEDVLRGVLVWALDGLARLDANRGRFTVQSSAQGDREDAQLAGSPLAEFMQEHYDREEGARSVPLSVFHNSYMCWRVAAGLKSQTQNQTAAELKSAGFTVSRPMTEDRRSLGRTVYGIVQQPLQQGAAAGF